MLNDKELLDIVEAANAIADRVKIYGHDSGAVIIARSNIVTALIPHLIYREETREDRLI